MEGLIIGGVLGLAFAMLALFGERWDRALKARRLRRHTCPTPCTESYWCRCGCSDGWTPTQRGTSCAVCGRAIVVDDEEEWGPYSSEGARQYSDPSPSEITQENPAPKGFTSWGWERDREFRRARHERRDPK